MNNSSFSEESFLSSIHTPSLSHSRKSYHFNHSDIMKLNEIIKQHFPLANHLLLHETDLYTLTILLQETSISALLPTLHYITIPKHYYSRTIQEGDKTFLVKQVLLMIMQTFNQYDLFINKIEMINSKKIMLIKQQDEEKRFNSAKKNKSNVKEQRIKYQEEQMKLEDSMRKLDIFIEEIEGEKRKILKEFNAIFALGRKILVSRMISREDIVMIYKMGYVYSTSNYKSNKHLKHFDIFYNVLEQLTLLTQETNIEVEEINGIISSVLDYFSLMIRDNYALINLLKSSIKTLELLLRLCQYSNLHSDIKSLLISLLAFIYEGSYNIHFHHLFTSTIKSSLFHYNQLPSTNDSIRLLSSQLFFISAMLHLEHTTKSKDPYQSLNSFISNNHPCNGVSMFLSNAQNINKAFTMVLSFQPKELGNDLEYPLITFFINDPKTIYLRLLVKRHEIILASKTKFIGSYEFEIGKTYMVIIDWKKEGIMGNRISFNLWVNKEEVKAKGMETSSKRNEIDLMIKERFEVMLGHDPEDNMKNFIGRINTVIMISKGLDNDLWNTVSDLYGDYPHVLGSCVGIDSRSYEEFSLLGGNGRSGVKQSKSMSCLGEFMKNNCLMVMSPLSVIGQMGKRNKINYCEVVYEDVRKDNKDKELMYNFAMFPLIDNCAMFTDKLMPISREFIRHDGFPLITLHLEYYYNLLFQKIHQGVQSEIMKGIANVIIIIRFYIEHHTVNFSLLKDQYSTFLFSLTKVITLMTDYNPYFSHELSTELILLFKSFLMILRNENQSTPIELKEYTTNMFNLLLNHKIYDLSNCSLLTLLFHNLSIYLEDIPEADHIITNQTLDLIMKYKTVFSIEQMSMTKEYKEMRQEYQGFLGAFISKCTIILLGRILAFIFDSPSTVQKYKLLKIYYYNHNRNLKDDKKNIDLAKRYHDYFDAQTIIPETPVTPEEIIVIIEDKYQEGIKAILLQLIIEAQSKDKENSNSNKTFLYDDIKRIKHSIVISSTNLINQKTNSSFNSLTNKSTNSSDGKPNDQSPLIRLKNIMFNGQISFMLIKSIFLLNYETWSPKAKVCFINESKTVLPKDIFTLYNSYNLCLSSFNKHCKNHLLFFIQLLYRIDNQDHSTLSSTVLLFCNYIHQVFKAYIKCSTFAKDPDPIKCQFNHLFESRSIMCSFFTMCFESIDTSEYAYLTLTEITSHVVWEHYNPFLFKFAYNHMKNNTSEVFFLMKHMAVTFLEQIAKDDSEYLPVDKSINIVRYLIIAHKLICPCNTSTIQRMTKEVIEKDCLSSILISLIKSFKNKSLLYYSSILVIVSKKYKINRTLYQIMNDLLLGIIEITEMDKELGLVDYLAFINNESSVFYGIDMKKRKESGKGKKGMNEDELFSKTEAELKARIPIKDQDNKMAVLDYYISLTRFMFRNPMFTYDNQKKILQREIMNIASTTMQNSTIEKDDDYLYNSVFNSIKFYKENRRSKINDPLKEEDLYESIDKIIYQSVENDKMEHITEITANTEKSSGSKGNERKDSFSSCKCNDIPIKKTQTFTDLSYEIPIIITTSTEPLPSYSFTDMHLDNPILCLKRDLLLKSFSYAFSDVYFTNRNFLDLKAQFHALYPIKDSKNTYYNQNEQQTLKFPSKIKNYSPVATFYPKIYMRQDTNIFRKANPFYNVLYPSFDRKNFRYKLFKVHHGLLNRRNMNLFSNESNEATNPLMVFPCERLSNDTTCLGYLYITKYYLLYQSHKEIDPIKEYEDNRNYLFTSYLYDIERRTKQIIIPMHQINELFSRRFLYYLQAIEVFMFNGKSYFFNLFSVNKQLSFIKAIESLNPPQSLSIIRNPKDEFNTIRNYKDKWRSGQLLTFDYLLQVNKFSGRSYNDLNQYPIMPWVIIPLSTNPTIRDFQYSISVQNESERIKAINRFTNSIDRKYASHFGIHFSNSAFVNIYLVRMLPFATNQIKFQTGKFDFPDRQFSSFESMVSSIMKTLDNRELIPELFVMPEFAYNLNYIEYGRRNSDKTLMNNFQLSHVFPSPLSLIIRLKATMNSKSKDYVNMWIDNIFGVNQMKTGKGFFTYPWDSYEQNVLPKLDKYARKIDNDYEKISMKLKRKIATIMPIGQFPIQLFDTVHPVYSKEKEKEKVLGKDIRNSLGGKALIVPGESAVNIMKNLTNRHIIYFAKSKTVNLLYFITSQHGKKNICIIDYDLNIKSHYALDRMALNPKINHIPIFHPKQSIIELTQCDMFILSRFYDNTIKVISMKSKLKYSVQTESFVTCLHLLNSSTLFSGHLNGKLIQWSLSYDQLSHLFTSMTQQRSLIAHKGSLIAIEANAKSEIVITAGGEDHQVYIRKMHDYELLSVIDLGKEAIAVDIQLAALYDMFYVKVFSWAEERYCLALYSINGLCFEMTNPCKWLEFSITDKNKLVYVDDLNTIVKVYDKDLKEETMKKGNDINKGSSSLINGMIPLEDSDSIVLCYDNGDFRRMMLYPKK